ncbi:STAS domain-containing protein [Cryptosporangium aurantiacum]|uniref:Anti-sigma factor antagonist n=1 Tax=Cryptosporangium aurantiacum TaxID=134849 RepID=A0A1M7QDY8_9ACTN|nr:STAS domain-containing protein [Cryptosporangium aurantiacum]SHN28967.1 anti-anti-sigma regulatory factor, SpoIIAA [Cryptosporangium aurantiacum]
MNLSVVVSNAGEASNVGVLRLSGELDIATSGTLRQSLDALRNEGRESLVLDLSGVTFCDSTGLGTVATHARWVMSVGGALVVCGLRPDVEAVFAISGLSTVLPTANSLDHAVELAAAGTSPN